MESTTPKIDVYKLVNDQIIASLENGVIPWQKPFGISGLPMNLLSKRQYRGINFWLLHSLPYEQKFFLTWDQIKDIGASVKKDEKGNIILYWKPIKKKAEGQVNGSASSVPVLQYYKVFNIAQCRDIREEFIPVTEPSDAPVDAMLECEPILQCMPDMPSFSHKGKHSYYNPETDELFIPKTSTFKKLDTYYSVLFHGLVQATAAKRRLNRSTIADQMPFGTETYTMESLIAEIGCAYLCGITGILPNEIKNPVSYIDTWLELFKKDNKFVVTAAGQAQKAVDLILNKQEQEAKEEVNESTNDTVVS